MLVFLNIVFHGNVTYLNRIKDMTSPSLLPFYRRQTSSQTREGNNPARHLIRRIFDSKVESSGAPSFVVRIQPRSSSTLNYDALSLFRSAVGDPPLALPLCLILQWKQQI